MRLFGEQFQTGVLRDPITAIMGGISAGTSLLGGIFGSHAASSAAQMQQDAAKQAGAGVTSAVNQVNPGIITAGQQAGQGVTDAAKAAAADAAAKAAAGGTAATTAAAAAGQGATDAATAANKLLDPYSQAGATAAGVLNAGIADGGEFNKAPTMADIQIDPGYAFRAQQGEQALERSAAAHGAVDTGGYLKDLTNYSQGAASQEYQNAFNRFETSTQNRFADVSGVANAGQAASNTQGANLIGAAQYGGTLGEKAAEYSGTLGETASQFGGALNTTAAKTAGDYNTAATDLTASNTIGGAKTAGDYLTQGANAAAAGKVGASNALWGGINGAANTGLQASLFSTLMKNPGANYFSIGARPRVGSAPDTGQYSGG